MDDADRKIPTHEITYARLRDMILYGHLAPGQPRVVRFPDAGEPIAGKVAALGRPPLSYRGEE